jgi:hypothetical protein
VLGKRLKNRQFSAFLIVTRQCTGIRDQGSGIMEIEPRKCFALKDAGAPSQDRVPHPRHVFVFVARVGYHAPNGVEEPAVAVVFAFVRLLLIE